MRITRPAAPQIGRPIACAAIAAALTVISGVPLSAQRITGRVVEDGSGERIASVQVSLVSGTGVVARTVMSDSAGYFVLDAAPGKYQLTAQRFGYGPYIGNNIELRRSETLTVIIRLAPYGIPVRAVEVTARGGDERGRDGFARRRALGKGVFLTVDSIRARGAIAATDAFHGVPAIVVSEGPTNEPSIWSMRGGKCMVFFIDHMTPPDPIRHNRPRPGGTAYGGPRSAAALGRPGLNESLDLNWIQGIEIYRDMSEVPKELRTAARMSSMWAPVLNLRDRSTPEACGMAVIWTKNGW